MEDLVFTEYIDSEYADLMNQTIQYLQEDTNSMFDKCFQNAFTGSLMDDQEKDALDIVILLNKLTSSYLHRKNDVELSVDREAGYYTEYYEIEKLREMLYCKGYKKIDEILALWNLGRKENASGIGNMEIEGTVTPFNIS